MKYDLKSLGDGAVVYFDPDSGAIVAEIKHVRGRGTYEAELLHGVPVEFISEDHARREVEAELDKADFRSARDYLTSPSS